MSVHLPVEHLVRPAMLGLADLLSVQGAGQFHLVQARNASDAIYIQCYNQAVHGQAGLAGLSSHSDLLVRGAGRSDSPGGQCCGAGRRWMAGGCWLRPGSPG